MNHVEHYHDWLRDAHAMQKQAESMLESMASLLIIIPTYVHELNNTLMKLNIKLPCWKKFSTEIIFPVRS